ncbi:uncharacterized protein [Triticum aestivum]|uniref:uncharacterized protein isoform X2 n=1 Tax=Triticum aestivum TaxID=4565 RepID=UPI001D00655E|nr:uncharacterized protein LOC123040708 isoform X2 [Triticum aestivum]
MLVLFETPAKFVLLIKVLDEGKISEVEVSGSDTSIYVPVVLACRICGRVLARQTEQERDCRVSQTRRRRKRRSMPRSEWPRDTAGVMLVFTDAAWKPGRENTTGIEISIQFAKEQQHVNISILVSEEPIISPLQAEAMALQVAAQVVIAITTGNIMFFTDNQVLAQAAQARDILKIPGHWQIRNQLANFFATTSRTQIAVHHIPRKLNDRAHNNARKAYSLQCNISPVMTCNSRSHLVEHCPYASEARQSKHQQL